MILEELGQEPVEIHTLADFSAIFSRKKLKKPLLLVLDEFDTLCEAAINALVGAFRKMFINRQQQTALKTEEKGFLLHGLALIGVRRALGVESRSGSPFNVQRSVRIPNLTASEVWEMFQWHQKESGQVAEKEAIDRLYFETQGQPGLIGWFGELLTEGWGDVIIDKSKAITLDFFIQAYIDATEALPNNNVLNIISKAKQPEYKPFVFDLFRTTEKIPFNYNNTSQNFLYMNGVIDNEVAGEGKARKNYVKFANPFVQAILFSHFSDELFSDLPGLIDPFADVKAVISETFIDIKMILGWYQSYLQANTEWLLKDVPRRVDLQVHEAVFHFNLYMYLHKLIPKEIAQVLPEFPTGNGKIDLLIRSESKTYGLELKSFKSLHYYHIALTQAAHYGNQLDLTEITLVFFISKIDDTNRQKLEIPYTDKKSKVCVHPVFIETGE